MKSRGLDEEAAYALLRKTAMSQGKRIAESPKVSSAPSIF